MKSKFIKSKDIIKNIYYPKSQLIYVIEPADWVIKWEGEQITKTLVTNNLIKADIRTTSLGLKNKIIHFGSINTILNKKGVVEINKSNKVVLTWYHIIKDDERAKFIPELLKKVDIFHTASNKTAKKLIKMGVPQNRIVIIPLGIDLNYFKPVAKNKKVDIRKKLDLPIDKIIIGSFQKDGVGWGKGLEPKLIKGPDIFCEVVKELSKKHDIFVLLTGPARGYVKKRLEKSNIPFHHKFLNNYLDIVDYYHALDLYLVTSREEGGPKAILECWATKIPLVSSDVGMISDISSDKEDILLTKIEDAEVIIKNVELLINDEYFADKLTHNGLLEVQSYTWEKISERYFKEIYSKLL